MSDKITTITVNMSGDLHQPPIPITITMPKINEDIYSSNKISISFTPKT